MLKSIAYKTSSVHPTGWVVSTTVEVAKDLLTPDEILTGICEVLEVDMAKVLSKTRVTPIVEARHIYFYFSKLLTTCKVVHLASVVRSKHHKSVGDGVKNVTRLLAAKDRYMLIKVNIVTKKLQQLQNAKLQ
jgi:chromosomal replication initiation ATPase DnaA